MHARGAGDAQGPQSGVLVRAHGCVGWYDWAIAHWGTKWGSYRCAGISGDERRAKIVFETAWSPPSPVLRALCRKHPGVKVRNRWHEEGGRRGNDQFADQSPHSGNAR